MIYIGIDSVLVNQKPNFNLNFSRKGLIGVGIEVSKIDLFIDSYNRIFEELMIEYGCENKKQIYCSRDLINLF